MKKRLFRVFIFSFMLSVSTILSAASFTGNWETNWGALHLSQSQNIVTGSYEGEFPGTLSGTINGNKLSFEWIGSNGERGKGFFLLSDSGNEINGKWGSGNSESNGGNWTGRRVQ